MLLAPSDFFTALRKGLKPKLPAELRGFRTIRGRGRLMKVYFEEPAFHYEAWHHTGAGRPEVGLHFESSPQTNDAAFDFFRARMVQVKASLPRAELEQGLWRCRGERHRRSASERGAARSDLARRWRGMVCQAARGNVADGDLEARRRRSKPSRVTWC